MHPLGPCRRRDDIVILFLNSLFACRPEVMGQRFRVMSYTTADGLWRGAISYLRGASHAFFRLCTRGGLNRGAARYFSVLPRWLRIAAAFMTLALVSGAAEGQQYQLRHYGVADGLAHGAVISIYQDRKGYLWFSTREGLSRFDGYAFVNYGERDGLEQLLINGVTEDKQGRIWVATNGAGVALFLGDSEVKPAKKFKNFLIVKQGKAEDLKRYNAVNCMLVDSQNDLWALTDGGLFRASLSGPDLNFEAVKTDALSDSSAAALEDSHGRLWFGYGNQLAEIRDGQLVNHGSVGRAKRATIMGIVEDSAGRILVADRYALYEFVSPASPGESGQWRKIDVKLKPKQQIASLLVDSAADLYIGTGSGLIKRGRDGRQTEIASKANGSYNAYALTEDREGNIWISAWTNGVDKLGDEMIVNFTNTDGSNIPAADIVEDSGVLKALISDGDIAEFSAGVIKHSEALEYPPTIDYSVEVGRYHNDWFGSWLGGHSGRFRKLVIRLRNGRELPLTATASIDELSKGVSYYEDQDGKLWVNKSQTDGKIYRADLTQLDHLTFESLAAEFHTVGYGVQMVGDGGGGLWLATAERLCHIRQDKFSCLQQTEGLPEIDPRSLFVDSRGWLWIGQRHKGVSVTKEPAAENPSFIHYSTANGLLSDTAWAFTEDDQGRVYVGTGKGLSRFDPRNNGWQGFTTKDGLAGNDIRSFYKDKQGNIWIAGGGVTRFDPRAEHKTLQPPPIYISRVNIMGEDLILPETGTVRVAQMRLAASLNNLTIDFVGVQFRGEDTLLYQHKLEGADADWSAPAKLRSVNYASLSPGSYRFLVRGQNRDGLISQPAVFEFRILRPIYLRWWFIALVMMSLAGIAFSLYRYRVRQLLALERVRIRIATDLHDDIGASLSRVAILSEVERQQNPGHNADSEGRLAEIANSARGLVDSMSDIVWSVDPRLDDLGNVVTRVRQFGADVFEAQGIEWELQVTPEMEKTKLAPEQRRDIFLICKEALNNIARHAGCRRATLSLRVSGPQILVEIKDDGRGFAMAPVAVENGRGGHGLANMQARAARLGGSLGIASDPGHGTQLNLSIPLHRQT